LFQRALQNHGVDSRVHYPVPIHGHRPYRSLASGVPLRNSEALAEAIVSLPLYPELTDEEVTLVTEATRLAGDEIAVAQQA
jgi:dTDP-4-amino-4,6-dideoxygalactose transaminase